MEEAALNWVQKTVGDSTMSTIPFRRTTSLRFWNAMARILLCRVISFQLFNPHTDGFATEYTLCSLLRVRLFIMYIIFIFCKLQYMKKRKSFRPVALCCLLLLVGIPFARTQQSGSSELRIVFRFVNGNDMFYAPWSDNRTRLNSLGHTIVIY